MGMAVLEGLLFLPGLKTSFSAILISSVCWPPALGCMWHVEARVPAVLSVPAPHVAGWMEWGVLTSSTDKNRLQLWAGAKLMADARHGHEWDMPRNDPSGYREMPRGCGC